MEHLEHSLIKPGKIEARVYQQVLATSILENKSSLLVIPTGLGKTNVAVLVIAHLLEKNPDSLTLFLAPTKPLCLQHVNTLKELMTISENEVGLLTGTTPIDSRSEIWKNSKVIVATPQTIERALASRRLTLDNVSLVIFDEAHRAVKNYAYTTIANEYMAQAKEPRILGLTASPGGTSEKINDVCRNLFIDNIEIRTKDDFDVRPYVQETDIEWVKVDLPEEFANIKNLLDELLRDKIQRLKELGYMKSTPYINKRDLLQIQGIIRHDINSFGRNKPEAFGGASAVASAMKIYHAIELLETQGISALNAYLERMKKEAYGRSSKSVKIIMADTRMVKAFGITAIMKQRGFEHPKLEKLRDIISEQFKNKPDSKVIVFTHFRDSATLVTNALSELQNVKPVRFVGQASRDKDKGLTQKQQGQIIKELKEGTHNLICSTSIGEEGLDLPSVDLVVFYESVPSEIRSIQRRGRTGRHSRGRVIMLMAKGTRDETYFWSSRAKEKKMIKTLNDMKKTGVSKIKQTSITSFFGTPAKKEEKPKVKIFADMRERNSGILQELIKKDMDVQLEQLKVGDFLITEEIAVERKELNDFVSSLIDGRLFSQVTELKENFDKPLIIVEGEGDIYSIRNVSPNAIRGAMSSLLLDYGIPIYVSKGIEDTAEILNVIARREQLDLKKEVRLRGEKRAMLLPENQQYIIEGLPGVGPTLAKQLLKHFGSVKAVITASERELLQAEGIGPQRAKEIKRVTDNIFIEN
ncbi:MAG: DEAD/DEAH box helicase [Candidatus Diapherotrites archaeon]|nr:DEAD/DEAH box helicase [Candidatus Diapherotrites archaeon]